MKTELYWIPGPWTGRLAILPRPRGNDWLEDEIRNWRKSGVDAVVSLLTDDEVADFALADEARLCREAGIEFLSFPVEDRTVPSPREGAAELVSHLAELIADGKTVAVHCRQGIGRAATIAIAILVTSGVGIEEAIRAASLARSRPVPETAEQREWLVNFARNLPLGAST